MPQIIQSRPLTQRDNIIPHTPQNNFRSFTSNNFFKPQESQCQSHFVSEKKEINIVQKQNYENSSNLFKSHSLPNFQQKPDTKPTSQLQKTKNINELHKFVENLSIKKPTQSLQTQDLNSLQKTPQLSQKQKIENPSQSYMQNILKGDTKQLIQYQNFHSEQFDLKDEELRQIRSKKLTEQDDEAINSVEHIFRKEYESKHPYLNFFSGTNAVQSRKDELSKIHIQNQLYDNWIKKQKKKSKSSSRSARHEQSQQTQNLKLYLENKKQQISYLVDQLHKQDPVIQGKKPYNEHDLAILQGISQLIDDKDQMLKELKKKDSLFEDVPFSKLDQDQRKNVLENQYEELIKKALSYSNQTVRTQTQGYVDSQQKSVQIFNERQDKLEKVSLQLRTNKQEIIELFEDEKHGNHANVGIFNLQNPGEKIHLTFIQDSKVLSEIIQNKIDSQINKHPDWQKLSHLEQLEKIFKKFIIGCFINLQIARGKVRIYISDNEVKPDQQSCQILLDSNKESNRQDIILKQFKIYFSSKLKTNDSNNSDSEIKYEKINRKNSSDINNFKKHFEQLKLQENESSSSSQSDDDFSKVKEQKKVNNIFIKSDQTLISLGSEVLQMAKQSLRNLQKENSNYQDLYQYNEESQDTQNNSGLKQQDQQKRQNAKDSTFALISSKRNVNITIEATSENCQGRLTCKSILFSKDLQITSSGLLIKKKAIDPFKKRVSLVSRQILNSKLLNKERDQDINILHQKKVQQMQEDLSSSESESKENIQAGNKKFQSIQQLLQSSVEQLYLLKNIKRARSVKHDNFVREQKKGHLNELLKNNTEQKKREKEYYLFAQAHGLVGQPNPNKFVRQPSKKEIRNALSNADLGPDPYILKPDFLKINDFLINSEQSYFNQIHQQRKAIVPINKKIGDFSKIGLMNLKQNSKFVKNSIQQRVQLLVHKRQLKINFLMFWASLAVQNKLVKDIDHRLKKKKRESLAIFLFFFMARKIQVNFRRYLSNSLHRKEPSQKLNRKQVLEFINLRRLKYSFQFICANPFSRQSIKDKAYSLLDNFFQFQLFTLRMTIKVKYTVDIFTKLQLKFNKRIRRFKRKVQMIQKYWDKVLIKCDEIIERKDIEKLYDFHGHLFNKIDEQFRLQVIKQYIRNKERKYLNNLFQFREKLAQEEDQKIKVYVQAFFYLLQFSIFNRREDFEEHQMRQAVNKAFSIYNQVVLVKSELHKKQEEAKIKKKSQAVLMYQKKLQEQNRKKPKLLAEIIDTDFLEDEPQQLRIPEDEVLQSLMQIIKCKGLQIPDPEFTPHFKTFVKYMIKALYETKKANKN